MSAVRARPRQDPSPAPVDFAEALGRLENKNPDRKYVAVNRSDQMALATYRVKGYEFETYKEGGVYFLATGYDPNNDGQQVEAVDVVLMSIDRKVYEAQEKASQEAATPLEKALIRKKGIPDGMRAIVPEFGGRSEQEEEIF